jgi:hypothetical protein
MIADLLNTQALGNEPRCTSVSQCVRSAVLRLDVQDPESVSYESGHRSGGQRTVRREESEKDLRMIRLGAHGIDVACDGFSYRLQKRIHLRLSSLQSEYTDDTPAPVDLVEAQRSHLATAHAINGKEHQDRAITDVRGRISSGMGQKSVDIRPRWT